MTHGINIANEDINIDGVSIKAHFWDFGGQEMMHSTHQFFLSTRCLYVLVLDGRKEEDSEYWLNFIRSFGGTSPVLVVLNKIDDNEGFEVNRKFLIEKYPNIVGFHRTSCLDSRGVEEFYSDLQKAMLNVELIKTKWGQSWFDVKTHIEALEENFINRDRFIGICDRFKVELSARDVLANYLDDLGIAIYFEDFNLNEIHTLKPEWVTNGVYKIVTSKELGEKKGLIDINAISQLLSGNDYPSSTHRYIIELMKKFELSYQLDNTLLVPSRFEVQEPSFELNSNDILHFEFHYSFLPLSIIDTFIVKSHYDIKDSLRWRSGVVLEDRSTQTQAVIKVDNREKEIKISVIGEQKRDFFAVIRKRFYEINSKFKEIEIDELIPLPNFQKVKVKYKELIGYEKAGRDDYFNGELGKAFSVSKLLNGIERPENRESAKYNIYTQGGDVTMGNGNISIGGSNTGVANSGNNNTITQQNSTITDEFQELLANFKSEATKVAEALPEEDKNNFEQFTNQVITDAEAGKKSAFFDISTKGLLDAAEAVGQVGIKLAGYIPKILKALED
jgi:GTPase SAR1 family protein